MRQASSGGFLLSKAAGLCLRTAEDLGLQATRWSHGTKLSCASHLAFASDVAPSAKGAEDVRLGPEKADARTSC